MNQELINIQDAITIVEMVKEKITDKSELLWTGYESAKELRQELEGYIIQLKNGDISCLDRLYTHFLPTCTFQEHSLMNGWTEEYMILSKKFDKFYEWIKSHS